MTTLEQVNLIGQFHQSQANYEKSLAVLTALKNYEISLQEIELVEGGWKIVPKPVEVPQPIAERMLSERVAKENGPLRDV